VTPAEKVQRGARDTGEGARDAKKSRDIQLFMVRLSTPQLEGTESDALEAEMRRLYPETFEPPTGVPKRRPHDLQIRLREGAKPFHTTPYRVTPLEDEEMQRQLRVLADGGWITDSHSPFAAPMIFVKKADGSLRLCVDFRPLNADTLKDRYPLPHMEDLLNEVHGSSHFTKLDLKSGYHQMRLRKEDREKTAFTTKYGLFEWTVVPFGLANAPSAFMRTMNKLLAKHRAYCVVYLDDILIHTSGGMDEHRAKVSAVVKTLRDDNWKLAPGKCVWGVAAVNFVGFLVNKDGIHVDPAKVKAVVEWPVPKSIKEVRAFLGLTGFYRRFIKGYAALAKPLHELIKKEQNFQVWEWPLEAMDAFHQLKDCLVTAPVLASPEPGNEDFLVHSDASNFAVGAVLSQWQQDSTTGRRQQRVIGFFSRKLTATECKYATYDRELMAIRDALQSWRFFVQGKHVDIFTDHRALERILKQRTLSSRQFNTLMDLNHFDYDIRYIPGAKNVVADRLSRRADHNTSQAALLVTEIPTLVT
jgi:hypothetical protein